MSIIMLLKLNQLHLSCIKNFSFVLFTTVFVMSYSEYCNCLIISYNIIAANETSLSSTEGNETTFPSALSSLKSFLGSLPWKYKDKYMAHCNAKEDCDAGFRMICNIGRCMCKTGDLFLEWPKYGCFSKVQMFGPCEVTGQCVAMNPNTYCNPENGRCTCSPSYFYNGRECSLRYDNSNLKAQEVYKAAVVAAACFIVAVVGIFVACIVRRREQHMQQSESNRNSDIFSISDEIAALRAVDKPPSYEEVLQIERTFYGIPPPEYSASRHGSSATNTPLSTPACAFSHADDASNMPYNPDYMPVNEASSNQHFDSVSVECMKESSQEITMSSRDSSTVQNTGASNFLAAAEVLPQPPDIQEDNVQPITTHSRVVSLDMHSHSSTQLPCHNQSYLKSVHSSSSLPGSPRLSSISSRSSGTILNHLSTRNGLLKQNSSSSVPNSPVHLLPDLPSTSHTEVSNSSTSSGRVRDEDSNFKPDCNHSDVAYDNLGFVSDVNV
ncbi:uncharacterized protein LOC118203544 isoform X2 [Stegodyphus dumicola]|uniref:uncharacterized protein LOC118203544 isoform X2 n=1 Tax=Stegodyphus dumicola TaxID=202533 RepID=UPI0015B08969|nr:uncharacterized protein LOC118203544 isoform X2 [Stegodyphus dumicola]